MEAMQKEITVVTKKDFITMWKAASNNVKRKPTYKEEKINVYNPQTYKYEPRMHKVKVKGFLYPEHHILYNIVRGLPTSRGFKENSDGYHFTFSFFRNKHPSKYFMKDLYEAFENNMTYEEFEKLIAEAHEIVTA